MQRPDSLQAPEGGAHVVPGGVGAAVDPDVACVLDGERYLAERPPARLARLRRRHADALQRLLPQRPVRLDLLAEVGVLPRALQQVTESTEERPQVVPREWFVCGYVVCSTRWMARTIRSNSARSAASWRRPDPVSV
jgi:hypothetical protein